MWWPYILLACVNGALLIALLASVISTGDKLSFQPTTKADTSSYQPSVQGTDKTDQPMNRFFARFLMSGNSSTTASSSANNKVPTKTDSSVQAEPESNSSTPTPTGGIADYIKGLGDTSKTILSNASMQLLTQDAVDSYIKGFTSVMKGSEFDGIKYKEVIDTIDKALFNQSLADVPITDVDVFRYVYIESPPGFFKAELKTLIDKSVPGWCDTNTRPILDLSSDKWQPPEWVRKEEDKRELVEIKNYYPAAPKYIYALEDTCDRLKRETTESLEFFVEDLSFLKFIYVTNDWEKMEDKEFLPLLLKAINRFQPNWTETNPRTQT
jgi:hypothetical protein